MYFDTKYEEHFPNEDGIDDVNNSNDNANVI